MKVTSGPGAPAFGAITARLSVGLGVVMGLAVAWPSRAQAQVIQGERDRFKSPQHFAIEIRVGPYTPNIDGEFNGARTPYRDFFGTSTRVMTQVEFDYQIIRHVGSAGIGIGLGYFAANGRNRAAGTGMLTEDRSTLKLIPISLSAVYRFDLPYERWKFPLVPYGKVGLDYAIWSITNGNGDVPNDPAGGQASGGTWGWHGAVGLSLVLDVFDPVTAHQFDVEAGVNRTHLFLELGHWDISGLGRPNKMHVGDTTWLGGMLFEF